MVIFPVEIPYCLHPWVEEIYFLERQGVFTDHRSIADVRSGIFIQWVPSEFTVAYDGKILNQSFAWGPSSYPKTVRFGGSVKAVVLILKPACSLPGISSTGLSDQTVYIADLIPAFYKKVQKATDITDVLTLLYSELFATIQPAHGHTFMPVIQALHTDHALTDIHVFCARMGITERSLERRMKSLLGLSPKAFQNIARFQSAYRELLSENRSLSDLAYDRDFSDHSHFTREFKRYAGFLPSKIEHFRGQVI